MQRGDPFRRMGHRVVVLEKKAADGQNYKRLCTHFIQPSATPLLAGLGLAHLHEPDTPCAPRLGSRLPEA